MLGKLQHILALVKASLPSLPPPAYWPAMLPIIQWAKRNVRADHPPNTTRQCSSMRLNLPGYMWFLLCPLTFLNLHEGNTRWLHFMPDQFTFYGKMTNSSKLNSLCTESKCQKWSGRFSGSK